MKHIYTNENIVLLQSAKNFLRQNGIESFIKNEHSIPNGARHGIENTFLQLWIINDADFKKAEALIAETISNPEPKPDWNCTKCSESNAGTFDFCWNCQSEAPPNA